MNLRLGNCTWIFLSKRGLWQETEAQDLIEYALLAGFMAVGAAAVVPGIVTSMGAIFTTVYNVLLIAVNAN
jgi:Flp pilus assembly pilin Flp